MNKNVFIESEYKLSGTLTIPENREGKHPAVLIIPGTGKSDRDGNDKKLKMNIYKEIADYLTSLGYVTLRYDKRGTHASDGDYYATGVQDLIDDAAECLRFLQIQEEVDREKIIILGHSEGALLAPAVHKQEPVAGLMLIAGAAESSKILLPKQLDMAMEEIDKTTGFKGWLYRLLKVSKKARKQNQKVMKKIMNSDKAVLRIQGVRVNAKWLRDQMSYNTVDYLKNVECSVLAVTGDKDIQVPPEHAQLIAETVKGEAEWHIIPDMNHILRKYEKDHTMLAIIKEYKSLLGQPTDPRLLSVMEEWLRKYYS